MRLTDRKFTSYECDHMRPVVKNLKGFWVHVKPNGEITPTQCFAGVYQVTSIVVGDHALSELVKSS